MCVYDPALVSNMHILWDVIDMYLIGHFRHGDLFKLRHCSVAELALARRLITVRLHDVPVSVSLFGR